LVIVSALLLLAKYIICLLSRKKLLWEQPFVSEQQIQIVAHDPNWQSMFESEKQCLAKLIKPWLCGSIEHIGSTSVTGLAAKPVIDIMVGVDSLAASQKAIEVLSDNGYCYYPYKAEIMHWFCKPTPEIRTHHLHLVPFKNELWHERIKFRDCLRTNPGLANEYAKLKLALAKEHKNNRELYTISKWPFIKKVIESN
jgi:GrpB-like predicted nucleotidyltransferase (UPF0157 family)